MAYKVSFVIGGKRKLSPKTFRSKKTAKRAIGIVMRIKKKKGNSHLIKHYKKIKNPRVIKIKTKSRRK